VGRIELSSGLLTNILTGVKYIITPLNVNESLLKLVKLSL
jgi:hypothetical protein